MTIRSNTRPARPLSLALACVVACSRLRGLAQTPAPAGQPPAQTGQAPATPAPGAPPQDDAGGRGQREGRDGAAAAAGRI